MRATMVAGTKAALPVSNGVIIIQTNRVRSPPEPVKEFSHLGKKNEHQGLHHQRRRVMQSRHPGARNSKTAMARTSIGGLCSLLAKEKSPARGGAVTTDTSFLIGHGRSETIFWNSFSVNPLHVVVRTNGREAPVGGEHF